MFHSARLKLTAWYLLIIMTISVAFSAFIYYEATREFDRALRVQRYRFEHSDTENLYPPLNQNTVLPPLLDTQVVEEEKTRALEGLAGINIIILLFSSYAGYFLAGRTLKPIKEMLDEQNRFITDASHELNTPLTSLKTEIEVTLRDKYLTIKKAKEALMSNLEEVDNLQALSDELIRLTLYVKPNGNFQKINISVAKIIETGINKVETLAKQKNITISSNASKTHILGDEKSLIEVIVILLDNAIKYSPNGKPVLISVSEKDQSLEIEIKDKGQGIHEKDIPRIFDRFYRTDKSRTKQNVAGYGLGLSIAKRIINLHNGDISVTSIINKGTIFTISLPKEPIS